jgi:hypothetical protein
MQSNAANIVDPETIKDVDQEGQCFVFGIGFQPLERDMDLPTTTCEAEGFESLNYCE